MTDTLSQQLSFPFDLDQERAQLGAKFGEFSAAADLIYRGACRSADGIIDMGRGLTDMVRLLGPHYTRDFVERHNLMDWSKARKYMRIFDRFKDRAITGQIPFTTLYLIAGVEQEDEFDAALGQAENGKTGAEIEQWLQEQRNKKKPGILVMNEAEVKHALHNELAAAGENVETEKVLANGGVVDLVTDMAVYECKFWLTRKMFYQALGQTETYCCELGKRRRVIAYSGIEEGLTVLAHQAKQNGVWLRQVQIAASAQENAA